MPTLIMKAKLEKPYEHWVKVFDNHRPAQEEAGLKILYRGHVIDDPSTIQTVIYTPSMEVMQKFMEESGEVITNAGHIMDSTEMTVCSDM